jgi:ABC-type molybdenum transport system ATPase subunit/photorepair protein PhrA/GNAT superfamily N-acetyltransferase
VRVDLDLKVEIERTPRAVQLEGIFDVPETRHATASYHFDVPLHERPWQIGLIVGPSGAGKTSVARHLFGDNIVQGYDWHPSRSLVDSFDPKHSIRDVTAALSAVGFSSPPSWLKPFRVLSNGEQFRSTMARALLDDRELIVVDEFTSVIDRTVARIGSCAISKAIRRSTRKFIAVSCHDDIVEWLQPDWILEPHAGRFAWRSLRRRPDITLEVRRCNHSLWSLFAQYHYLTGEINRSATCFAAYLEGRPVCFDAWLPFVGRLKDERRARRGHRTVCLPDFQGIGIGRALVETCASMWAGLGYRVFSRTGHPAEMASRRRSSHWRVTGYGFTAKDTGSHSSMAKSRTTDRRALSSEWIGPAMNAERARKLANAEC